MWKMNNNQNGIIAPDGRTYGPTEVIKLFEEGKKISKPNNNHHQTSHSCVQSATQNQNWMEAIVTMLNTNPQVTSVASQKPSTEADLMRIFIKKIDEENAQLVEFLDDGTVLTSNKFNLPRGKDGLPGPSNAYQHYMTYEVNANSFVFNDYDPNYDYCFYFYFSLLLNNYKIVGRLEVPTGLDPDFLVSNVAIDYSRTSSIIMFFDTASKTLMAKNWSEIGVVISKIDVYRKPGTKY